MERPTNEKQSKARRARDINRKSLASFFRDFAQKRQLLGSYRVDYAGKSIRIVHSDYGEKNSTKTYSAERRKTLHPKSSTKALKKNPTGSKKTYVPQNSSKIMEILFVSLFLRFRVWKK